MCFIDKAYDSVDQELFVGGARTLLRARDYAIIIVIGEFHEGMRACVRSDDGEHSEWFDVTQGLWQGCVLSALLSNVFFAAVIHTVLVRFIQ